MKTRDKEKDILKGIMKYVIQSPEDENFNKVVLDRFIQEKAKSVEKGAMTITLPAILLMVFSFIFIFTSLMTPVIGELAGKTGLHMIQIMDEIMAELTGLIYHSPAFVLVFGAMILLYHLDRFLGKQTYSS